MKKKGFIIGGASAIVVIAAAIVLVLCLGNKEELYRVIKVLSVNGQVVADRESVGELDAYEGMVLQSGDNLHVSGNSGLVLTMDEDKVAYVEENTQFSIIAEGTAASSKTYIDLEYGAINCEVRNKLSNDSSYEVHTPNSTIAIRGTDIQVECCNFVSGADVDVLSQATRIAPIMIGKDYSEANAEEQEKIKCVIDEMNANLYSKFTQISVFDGEIQLFLLDANGNHIGNPLKLGVGNKVIIGGGVDDSKVITQGGIVPDTLRQQTLENLITISGQSGKCCISGNDLSQRSKTMEESPSCKVTFIYNNNVFGQQEVTEGEKATEPSLIPNKTGKWDVSFDNPITRDTEIVWRDE